MASAARPSPPPSPPSSPKRSENPRSQDTLLYTPPRDEAERKSRISHSKELHDRANEAAERFELMMIAKEREREFLALKLSESQKSSSSETSAVFVSKSDTNDSTSDSPVLVTVTSSDFSKSAYLINTIAPPTNTSSFHPLVRVGQFFSNVRACREARSRKLLAEEEALRVKETEEWLEKIKLKDEENAKKNEEYLKSIDSLTSEEDKGENSFIPPSLEDTRKNSYAEDADIYFQAVKMEPVHSPVPPSRADLRKSDSPTSNLISEATKIDYAYKSTSPPSPTIGRKSPLERSSHTSSKKHILTPSLIHSLSDSGLPLHLRTNTWHRSYSLSRDGSSFSTFLNSATRGLSRDSRTETLMVILTSSGEIFGGFSTDVWKKQSGADGERFFGRGGCWLFKVEEGGKENEEEIKYYRWTGANLYCQSVSVVDGAVGMGGGGGFGFGFRVNDDFSTVTSDKCATFNNDILFSGGVSMVLDVELWRFK